jgi:catechol 2,3-dioxygenase-like lactoylglutathione lyase family enzyme
MTVLKLDHVNIRTPDPAATIAFLAEILDLTAHNPFADDPDYEGGWMLDSKGEAVIHVGSTAMPYPTDDWHPFEAGARGGPVHHVAFACQGHDTVVSRLNARNLRHSTNHLAQIGLRQVFVIEPGGVMLELNFFGD